MSVFPPGVPIENTYAASTAVFTPAGAATDVFELFGSASKIVKVQKITLGFYTAGPSEYASPVALLKRSTAPTGGTAVNATKVPLNSTSPAATVNKCRHYTANPSGGTLVGGILRKSLGTRLQDYTTAFGYIETIELFEANPEKGVSPIILNGIAEGVSVNFNGGTAPGSMWVDILFTEV